jgi:integrase
VSDARPSGTA